MNSFLNDREFGKMYELYFCDELEGKMTSIKGFDNGVDFTEGETAYDVKAYRKPLFGNFSGVFLETFLPLSGKPGWLLNDKLKTDVYIFVIDAYTEKVYFNRAYFITKEQLMNAVQKAENNDDLEVKKVRSADGIILPYHYLDEFAEDIWIGEGGIMNDVR